MTDSHNDRDVVLIGAGIMSATLATFFKLLEPDWTIEVFEKLGQAAEESSNGWNNAGTGHSALCELNYTPENSDGSVGISKAVDVNEQFQLSRQFWGTLVKDGHLTPDRFIHSVPHMSFVNNAGHVKFLETRWNALKDHPLFGSMEFAKDSAKIGEWAPLLVEGRDKNQPIAATHSPYGTDVDFGALTNDLLKFAESRGTGVHYNSKVADIKRRSDGKWQVTVRMSNGSQDVYVAPFVFVGAGGGSLPLLQKSGIPEIKGFAGFPISGQFLRSKNPTINQRHLAKVYGQAAVGAPPMSVPHLDTRYIDGQQGLLFGPYAGWSPKFLKSGSWFDLFGSIRGGNIAPMTSSGLHNLDLVKYLAGELVSGQNKRLAALRQFFPEAQAEDWELITAGQRVQVIKKNPNGKGGVLQFGTEVVSAADGSIAGLLGASPGASTAVPIMLGLLKKSFPEQTAGKWAKELDRLVPTRAIKLSDDAAQAKKTFEWTAEALHLTA